MKIVDGVAYAAPILRVCGVRPLANHKLWVRFSNGEAREFDFAPLLDEPCFAPLRDEKKFQELYIDYGVLVWDDGKIDIAPEYLYENGTPSRE